MASSLEADVSGKWMDMYVCTLFLSTYMSMFLAVSLSIRLTVLTVRRCRYAWTSVDAVYRGSICRWLMLIAGRAAFLPSVARGPAPPMCRVRLNGGRDAWTIGKSWRRNIHLEISSVIMHPRRTNAQSLHVCLFTIIGVAKGGLGPTPSKKLDNRLSCAKKQTETNIYLKVLCLVINCECECHEIYVAEMSNMTDLCLLGVFFSSSKYSETRFRPGIRPGSRWGSLRRSPDP